MQAAGASLVDGRGGAMASSRLCSREASATFITPAYPDIYATVATHNATYLSELCWPVEPWGACDPQAEAYWAVSQWINALSNLAIFGAGMLSLLSSNFSDELGDIASAMTAVNGIGGCLAHATELRVWEEFDLISMLMAGLLFFKAMLRALFPNFNSWARTRTLFNMTAWMIIFTACCWSSFNVPPEVYNSPSFPRKWASDYVTPLVWICVSAMTVIVSIIDPDFLVDLSLSVRSPTQPLPSLSSATSSRRRPVTLRVSTKRAIAAYQESAAARSGGGAHSDGGSARSDGGGAEAAAATSSTLTPAQAATVFSAARRGGRSRDDIESSRAQSSLRGVVATGTVIGLLAGLFFFLDR